MLLLFFIALCSAVAPCTVSDIDENCRVDIRDLSILLLNWGPCVSDQCPGTRPPGTVDRDCSRSDFTGDCTVGITDLSPLLNSWGACQCEPREELVCETPLAPHQGDINLDAMPRDLVSRARDQGENGRTFTYRCTAEDLYAYGGLWGGPIVLGNYTYSLYTADSNVCRAAVHYGAIGIHGGSIRFKLICGAPSYTGSFSNGIISKTWNQDYFYSIYFLQRVADPTPAPALPTYTRLTPDQVCAADTCSSPCTPETPEATLTLANCQATTPGEFVDRPGVVVSCICPAELDSSLFDSAWGSSWFTFDSDICTAARLLNKTTIVFQMGCGQQSYAGATANGITTSDWGTYYGSFRVL